MDQALTLHLGIVARLTARQELHLLPDERDRFRQTGRRWEGATKALNEADEAEEFQAVGMRCRECLLALIGEAAPDVLVPEGEKAPKRGDFVQWSEVILNGVLPGPSAERLRSYAKSVAKATWELVQWLTHAVNATRHDALMALEATGNVLNVFITAVVRWERGRPDRCPECGSYQIVSDFRRELFEKGDEDPYVTICESCGWEEEESQTSD